MAAKLAEEFNLKIFRMDEMIKEVVDYVSPKQQEVPDPKAKAPAKGKKGAEEVPTDPYEGLDTTEYKEIGQQIKKFFGDGELPAMYDLVGSVTDDSLLVRLFIAKLKLVYNKVPSASDIEDQIRADVIKEAEVVA